MVNAGHGFLSLNKDFYTGIGGYKAIKSHNLFRVTIPIN